MIGARAEGERYAAELAPKLPLQWRGTRRLNSPQAAISLALLGVDEGAAASSRSTESTLGGTRRRLTMPASDSLTFDWNVSVRRLAMNDAKLASDVVHGIDASLIARGVLDDHGVLRLDDAGHHVRRDSLHRARHLRRSEGARDRVRRVGAAEARPANRSFRAYRRRSCRRSPARK